MEKDKKSGNPGKLQQRIVQETQERQTELDKAAEKEKAENGAHPAQKSIENARKLAHAIILFIGDILASKPEKGGAELTLAKRSMQMARGWMGKVKGALGIGQTYKVVDDVKDIPATMDVDYPVNTPATKEKSLLQKVNELRENISLIDKTWVAAVFNGMSYPEGTANVIQHLTEASMWLGYVLQEIKE